VRIRPSRRDGERGTSASWAAYVSHARWHTGASTCRYTVFARSPSSASDRSRDASAGMSAASMRQAPGSSITPALRHARK